MAIIQNLLSPRPLLDHIRRLESEGGHRQSGYRLGEVDPEQLANLLEGRVALQELDSREFEIIVAELIKADGYDDVNLVPRHNAPGPDIIAYNKGPSGQTQRFLIECKKSKRSVGVNTVRTLVHRMDYEHQATGGIVVAASRFTKDAKKGVEKYHKWRVALKDGKEILEWINKNATPQVIEIDHMTKSDTAIIRLLEECKNTKLELVNNTICQSCGGDIVCGYIDLGGVDHYDNYFHICIGCNKQMHREPYEPGWVAYNEELAKCPFCGRIW